MNNRIALVGLTALLAACPGAQSQPSKYGAVTVVTQLPGESPRILKLADDNGDCKVDIIASGVSYGHTPETRTDRPVLADIADDSAVYRVRAGGKYAPIVNNPKQGIRLPSSQGGVLYLGGAPVTSTFTEAEARHADSLFAKFTGNYCNGR